jgi:hypothetical protein
MAKTQAAAPTGSALRTKTPQSRSGRFVEPGKPVLAGALLSPAEQHASQRTRPGLVLVSSSPPKSAAQSLRSGGAPAPPVFEDSLSFRHSLEALPQSMSAHDSVVEVPPHGESVISLNLDGSYQPRAVEDDNGLREDSLSAYGFLLNPDGSYKPSAVEDDNGLREDSLSAYGFLLNPDASQVQMGPLETARPGSDAMLNPRNDASVAAATPPMSSPRGPLWGSAASIGHTTLNSKVHPASVLQNASRASLLPSPAQAAENMRVKDSSSQARKPTSASKTKESAVRAVELALRAEAVVSGEMKGFALTGSVKTTAMPTPSPPVVSRPPVAAKTAAANTGARQTVARMSPAAAARGVGTKRDRDASWTAEQVWQRSYGSMEEHVSGAVASTPSVLLQGGEFMLPVNEEMVGAAGSRGKSRGIAAAVGLQGSVDSLPANNSKNLGENAFD